MPHNFVRCLVIGNRIKIQLYEADSYVCLLFNFCVIL